MEELIQERHRAGGRLRVGIERKGRTGGNRLYEPEHGKKNLFGGTETQ